MNNQFEICQHNELIQMNQRLSLGEKRLMAYALMQVRPNDKDFDELVLNITEFAALYEISQKSVYSEYNKISDLLQSRVVTKILSSETGKRQEVKFSITHRCRYNEGEGTISFQFHEDMKPYLLDLNQLYTKYSPHEIKKLQRVHSLRVFELLKQYQTYKRPKPFYGKVFCPVLKKNIDLPKKNYFRVFTVTAFKELLGIDRNYPEFKSLNRSVLMPVIKELNDKTASFNVQLYFKKKGRSVAELVFIIDSPLEEKQETSTNPALVDRMVIEFDIDKDQAFSLFEEFQDKEEGSYIESVLNHVGKLHNSSPRKNLAGYTVQAIKKDYRSNLSEAKAQTSPLESAQAPSSAKIIAQGKTVVAKLQKMYEGFVQDSYWNHFCQLDVDDQVRLQDFFLEDANSPGTGELFDDPESYRKNMFIDEFRNEFDNQLPISQAPQRFSTGVFVNFLKAKHPISVLDKLSFIEEYVELKVSADGWQEIFSKSTGERL